MEDRQNHPFPSFDKIGYYELIQKGVYSELRHDGSMIWLNQQGYYHNSLGPAKIYPDGTVSYHLEGYMVDFDYWCKATGKTEDEIIMLKLKYGSGDYYESP